MLPTAELDYALDPACIATHPATPRDAARLLIVRLGTDDVIHARVRDLPQFLTKGDLLVANHTRVAPVRLVGRREDGRPLEALAVSPCGERAWRALVKGAKRFRPGDRLTLNGPIGAAAQAVLRARDDEFWIMEFEADPALVLASVGRAPLPPYILGARADRGEPADDGDDLLRYQTTYAAAATRPSVAAPTAGLHFTDELRQTLVAHGVGWSCVELQVGLGTFKPVETQWLEEHRMHAEWCSVDEAVLAEIAATRRAGGRVIAVGTTPVRVLESLPDADGGGAFESRLLISPGFQFRFVDGLLTNFHLPRSTLLALVGALVGLDRLKRLYDMAQREGYRFYSFGDAMLILPEG